MCIRDSLYTGNVYRVEQTQGARQREFTQSGIELIGSYSPAADAEVISAAMEAVPVSYTHLAEYGGRS